MSDERFSSDEVGDLIGEAAMRQAADDGLTIDELQRVADELGVSREALDEVLRERRDAEDAIAGDELSETRREQRQVMVKLGGVFVGVGVGLTAIDVIPDASWDWSFYPMAGIAIAFVIVAVQYLFGDDG